MSQAAQLLRMAWEHESMEGDVPEKHQLIDWAQQNGLSRRPP